MYKAILVALIVFISSQYSYGGETWELLGNSWGEVNPKWSHDGSMIAYVDLRNGNWSSDIYTVSATGETTIPLVVDTSQCREPTWSPDGREIAYRSDRTGNWDIFVVELSTGISRQLTYHPDDDSWPSWSPDGSEIVFSSVRDGERDLYIIPAEGGTARKVAETPTWDEFPCWSRDGQTLLYTALFTGNCDIYQINVDGTGFAPIIATQDRECEAVWSYDGSMIAYIGSSFGSEMTAWEIYLQPYPSGEVIRLTDDNYVNGWPCYSPDGRYLVYAKHTNNWDIWIYDLQGIVNIEKKSLGEIKATFR